jgi:hypothetical protein
MILNNRVNAQKLQIWPLMMENLGYFHTQQYRRYDFTSACIFNEKQIIPHRYNLNFKNGFYKIELDDTTYHCKNYLKRNATRSRTFLKTGNPYRLSDITAGG